MIRLKGMIKCEKMLGGCGFISPLNNWQKKEDSFYQDPTQAVYVAGKIVKVFSSYCPKCGKKYDETPIYIPINKHWKEAYEKNFI